MWSTPNFLVAANPRRSPLLLSSSLTVILFGFGPSISADDTFSLCAGSDKKGSGSPLPSSPEEVWGILSRLGSSLSSVASAASLSLTSLLSDPTAALSHLRTAASETLADGTVSWGFLSGFAAGYAAKKVGRTAAFLGGLLILGAKGLEVAGLLVIDYDLLREEVQRRYDEATGGNNAAGKAIERVRGSIVKGGEGVNLGEAYEKAMSLVEGNKAAGTGFSLGLVAGFRVA